MKSQAFTECKITPPSESSHTHACSAAAEVVSHHRENSLINRGNLNDCIRFLRTDKLFFAGCRLLNATGLQLQVNPLIAQLFNVRDQFNYLYSIRSSKVKFNRNALFSLQRFLHYWNYCYKSGEYITNRSSANFRIAKLSVYGNWKNRRI